jgi:hypothetical protein
MNNNRIHFELQIHLVLRHKFLTFDLLLWTMGFSGLDLTKYQIFIRYIFVQSYNTQKL